MKTLYTTIDPIPSTIPRQLAIELLHSHGEIISVNPLVLDHRAIKAPRDAPNDEYYATWYEIDQRIQFVPGIGKMGSGKVSFRGCFHDMPWGVQTHMYVPFGVDLRHKYQIKGNQPGEPPEPRELGSNAPDEGLYLRVDTQIKANMTMMSFIKKELKVASKTMIDRMIKKAQLIDSGVLQAMLDDAGRLKTVNPHDRTTTFPPETPAGSYSPSAMAQQNMRWRPPSQSSPTTSAYGRQSGYMPPNSPGPYQMQQSGSPFPNQQHNQQQPGNVAYAENTGNGGLAIEMPGDMQYPSQSPAHLQPPGNHRFSSYSELSGASPRPFNDRWSSIASDQQSSTGSIHSRPTSYSVTEGHRSPRPEGRTFAAELPSNEAGPKSPQMQSAYPAFPQQQNTYPASTQPQQQGQYQYGA